MRDENAALRAGDQLFHTLRAADELDRAAAEPTTATAATCRHLALLLRPETIVRKLFQDAVLDIRHPLHRRAVGGEGLREQIGIGRIGIHRHARIADLLTELGATTRLAEGAATFVVAARVERAEQTAHDVRHRSGFQHHRVEPGLDRLRIAARSGLRRRGAPERGCIDFAPVTCTRIRPAGTGAIRRARGDAKVCTAAAVIREQATTGRDRARPRIRLQETGDEDVCIRSTGNFGGVDRRLHRGRTLLGIESGGGIEVAVDGRVLLRAEFGDDLGIVGAQSCERFGEFHRSSEARVIEHVRLGAGATLADRGRDGDRRIRRATAGRDFVAGEAGVARPAAVDVHACLVGLRERQHTVSERLGFITRQVLAIERCGEKRLRFGVHQASRPVFTTLMPRKRAGGQP